ncbi:DUF349 domain-containing protein [Phycicoccus sp. Root101]|uniref:DUF349 domain-containing protein n=1 Tax=Phycicoccus sp. Root101 TaxID=1736421 RepID=UPI0009EB82E2|nr:DUF349 domain-containing protein [Phycicoccus sp. Root101]
MTEQTPPADPTEPQAPAEPQADQETAATATVDETAEATPEAAAEATPEAAAEATPEAAAEATPEAAPEAVTEEAPAAEDAAAQAPEPEAPAAAQAETPEPEAPAAEAASAGTPEPEAPAADAPAAAVEPEAAPAPEPEAAPAEPEAPAGEDVPAEVAPAAPAPAARPRPVPKPAPIPSPAAVRKVAHPLPTLTAAAPSGPPAETFGRVAEDGTVFVRTADGEKEVGAYPGATPDEALHYFARKYDELFASADLLHQRVTTTDLSAKDGAEGLTKLREHAAEAGVVGDLEALEAKIAEIGEAVAERKKTESAERNAARAIAATEREAIVAEAEKIAGQPENKIQWKSSGARMRELLDEWKKHQRAGTRLDRETEGALWQRFSQARNSFDKARRVHFAQLESTQGEAKAAKQDLVKEAESLATSTDWGATAGAFKRLMDRWRQAGRASRTDDDALWARFKAAQDAFFTAKDAEAAKEDEEFRGNLAVKEELLKEAEAILPVTDLDAAKAALRAVQDRWEAAGKVPRGDVDRMEKGMRRIESAVREADEKRWHKTNPEVAARAQSMVDQLESSVAALKADVEKAQASGNEKKVKDAQSKLEAQEQWLAQARGNLDEFGG